MPAALVRDTGVPGLDLVAGSAVVYDTRRDRGGDFATSQGKVAALANDHFRYI